MKFRSLSLLMFLVSVSSALADEANPQAYDTLDEAAVAAEQAAMPLSSHYEYGGVIYTTNEKFYFSPAQTSHDPYHIKITARVAGHVVALYHTHPGAEGSNRYFSPDDVDTATRLKLASFIGVMLDGSIHKFLPGVTRPERDRTTLGETVKHE